MISFASAALFAVPRIYLCQICGTWSVSLNFLVHNFAFSPCKTLCGYVLFFSLFVRTLAQAFSLSFLLFAVTVLLFLNYFAVVFTVPCNRVHRNSEVPDWTLPPGCKSFSTLLSTSSHFNPNSYIQYPRRLFFFCSVRIKRRIRTILMLNTS